MKRLLILSVLFAGSLFAAERPVVSGGAGGSNTPPAGAQAGQGEQRQRPDPAQTAAKMMSGFDANKDGVLSQAELALALEDMHKNRPQRPAHQGGASTGAVHQASGQSVQGEQRPEHPPADKVAAEMLEKFSSNKTGLTQAELAKALEEQRSQRGGNRGERRPRNDQNAK